MKLVPIFFSLALSASLLVTALPLPIVSSTVAVPVDGEVSATSDPLAVRGEARELLPRSWGSSVAGWDLKATGSVALGLHRKEFETYITTLKLGQRKPVFKLSDPLSSLKARTKWNKDAKALNLQKSVEMDKYDRNIQMMKYDKKSWLSDRKVAKRLYTQKMSWWDVTQRPSLSAAY